MTKPLHEDVADVRAALDAALPALGRLMQRCEKLSLDISGSDVAPIPLGSPPPAPVLVLPLPSVPRPVPSDTAYPWVPHVKWTTFGNHPDEVAGVWKELAYDTFHCSPGSGMHDAFAALPFPCKKGDLVDIRRLDTGAIITAMIGDLGPGNTRDRYLPVGGRPAAESGIDEQGRKTAKAGIDLTPALVALISTYPAQVAYDSELSGYVDVRWRPAPTARDEAVTDREMWEPGAAVARAAGAMVGVPFHYFDPKDELEGDLGCADVVSVALIHAGVITDAEHQIGVDALVSLLMHRHGWTETGEPRLPGDVVQWGPNAGGTHGHIAVLMGDGTAVHNSSSHHAVERLTLAGYTRPVVRVLRAPKGSAS